MDRSHCVCGLYALRAVYVMKQPKCRVPTATGRIAFQNGRPGPKELMTSCTKFVGLHYVFPTIENDPCRSDHGLSK
jgi:hypothetical protein